MFEVLMKLLGRSKKKTTVETSLPQQKQKKSIIKDKLPIPYRTDLINELKNEHQSLLHLHSEILSSAEQRNGVGTASNIKEFNDQLSSHLKSEFKELYIFLEFFAMQHMPETKKSIRDFKIEMHEISRAVMGVIHKHEAEQCATDESFEAVITDFSQLGSALVDRITREEAELYSMYETIAERFEFG
jgi:hypothetical protein